VFFRSEEKTYWRCNRCEARYLDTGCLPAPAAEQAHYLLHRNEPHDARYRIFLSKLATPLLGLLTESSRGLDFGCGPGPALAFMLREAGHQVALYDPLFWPDRTVLNGHYDFVTCTETAEHFHDPASEFSRLMDLVRPGGLLAIMTCFQTDDARFANWHYRKDPTHVVFYREKTFQFLAAAQGWSCDIPVKDVAFLRRPIFRFGP